MRTTVTLDGDVLRLLQDEMHRTRASFKQSLNQAIRRGLARRGGAAPARFEVRARPMGLRSGIDPSRLGQLADQMETEALVQRMRRTEAAERTRQKRARAVARRKQTS